MAVSPKAPEQDDAAQRRALLKQEFHEARGCTRCAQLAASRTNVVFGSGHADASLMLIGDVPTAREDEEGVPFTGAAGKLLDDLLGSIGIAREDVFVTHALQCRPPGNRDADPTELAKCRPYLEEQVRLVRPRVVCTLGNLATRAVTGDATPVTRRHGDAEIAHLGGVAVYVVPLYHPAAALYTRSLLNILRADVTNLPELLARPALTPQQRSPARVIGPAIPSAQIDEVTVAEAPELAPEEAASPLEPPDSQLGLF